MAKPSFLPAYNAALVLADGTLFLGQGVGKPASVAGEICFNTAMTGYQEILTDPSYCGQIITFTTPHIGNVGCNGQDVESGLLGGRDQGSGISTSRHSVGGESRSTESHATGRADGDPVQALRTSQDDEQKSEIPSGAKERGQEAEPAMSLRSSAEHRTEGAICGANENLQQTASAISLAKGAEHVTEGHICAANLKSHATGLILRELPSAPSNFRSEMGLNEWLMQKGLTGIAGLDTRALTHHIRRHGAQNVGIAFIENASEAELLDAAKQALATAPDMHGLELAGKVTTKESYSWDAGLWQLPGGSGQSPVVSGQGSGIRDEGGSIPRHSVGGESRSTESPATGRADGDPVQALRGAQDDELKGTALSEAKEGGQQTASAMSLRSSAEHRTDVRSAEQTQKLQQTEPSMSLAKGAEHRTEGAICGANEKLHITAIDYGAKHNILRHLASLGARVTVLSATATAEEVLATKPDGVFLSNGPGDPAATAQYALKPLQDLLKTGLPIFGICLGHQLLATALGAKTVKMAQGHRGANHPVQHLATKKVEITSQNHGFAVSDEGLPGDIIVTHRSLFDGTIAGIAHKTLPVFSVQYHPESSPGPHDSEYLFGQFIRMVRDQGRGMRDQAEGAVA